VTGERPRPTVTNPYAEQIGQAFGLIPKPTRAERRASVKEGPGSFGDRMTTKDEAKARHAKAKAGRKARRASRRR
jgi:hypothetical protein